ncbi:MAG: hypothetical protein K2G56_04350, partial [Eubacterium sp.]|nr:hypothetical protein [Eubacterium sp.]
ASDEYCFFVDENDAVIGTNIGIYNSDAPKTEKWIPADKVLNVSELTEQQIADGYYMLKDAVKVRWSYYDVPAGTIDNPIVFANEFVLKGNGRYRDIRTDAQKLNTVLPDIFNYTISADVSYIHNHSEVIENTIADDTANKTFNEKIELVGSGSTTKYVYLERPIITVHTQIFDDETKAEAPYDANAAQVKGYRPGETVWYKTSVLNNKQVSDHVQGALLEPVLFDKIPEYITTSGLDTNNIKVVWYDANGNPKPASEIPAYTISKTQITAPDFAGDMVTNKSDTDGVTFAGGNVFADFLLDPNSSRSNTVSSDITYNVYTIQFAKGSRLEIGESVEVYYEAQIRYEDLPLSYTTRNNGIEKTFVDYYPKMSEYYQSGTAYHNGYLTASYPYIGGMNPSVSDSAYTGSFTQFKNANAMMDMNYLYHDVGVSGTRNKNIDKFDYLKDATVYMPGYSGDENYNGYVSSNYYVYNNYGGSNG